MLTMDLESKKNTIRRGWLNIKDPWDKASLPLLDHKEGPAVQVYSSVVDKAIKSVMCGKPIVPSGLSDKLAYMINTLIAYPVI